MVPVLDNMLGLSLFIVGQIENEQSVVVRLGGLQWPKSISSNIIFVIPSFVNFSSGFLSISTERLYDTFGITSIELAYRIFGKSEIDRPSA